MNNWTKQFMADYYEKENKELKNKIIEIEKNIRQLVYLEGDVLDIISQLEEIKNLIKKDTSVKLHDGFDY